MFKFFGWVLKTVAVAAVVYISGYFAGVIVGLIA
jgi:hypothetical protein